MKVHKLPSACQPQAQLLPQVRVLRDHGLRGPKSEPFVFCGGRDVCMLEFGLDSF